jgi:tripartite-type tricarboxylate transporter receptor subunit TctC
LKSPKTSAGYAAALPSLNRIIRLPGIAMKCDEQGMTPAGGSPTEFGTFVSSELRRWKDAARAANVGAQ